MTPEQKNSALQAIEKGMSINSVAEYFDVSRQYLHRISPALDPEVIKQINERDSRLKIGALVTQAIAKGILVPEPCEVCKIYGKDEKGKRLVDAHHDDYNKPLDVRWLCHKHHQLWHSKNKAIKCAFKGSARKHFNINLKNGGVMQPHKKPQIIKTKAILMPMKKPNSSRQPARLSG